MLYIDITSIVLHHGELKFDFFVLEDVAESWLLFEFDLKTCNRESCQQQGFQVQWMYRCDAYM